MTAAPVTGAAGYPGAAATTVSADCRAHDEWEVVERSPSARQGQIGEVGLEQRQHRLGLRITEADVVLDEPRTVGGQHQPGEQHTDVRRSVRREVVEDRLDERRQQVVGRIGDGGRCVGAHATGVRSRVALADALVVLGDRQRHGSGAVAECEQRAFGAVQSLLQHEGADGGRRRDRVDGLRIGRRHRHALARREAVELDDDRARQPVPPGDRFAGVVETAECRAGDAE